MKNAPNVAKGSELLQYFCKLKMPITRAIWYVRAVYYNFALSSGSTALSSAGRVHANGKSLRDARKSWTLIIIKSLATHLFKLYPVATSASSSSTSSSSSTTTSSTSPAYAPGLLRQKSPASPSSPSTPKSPIFNSIATIASPFLQTAAPVSSKSNTSRKHRKDSGKPPFTLSPEEVSIQQT
eukprot:CAMPEP_0201559504 /NCGR_PEP_ID=MMETSP0173_2-20130828/74577_1 /ASSEMBLY_ACC=CAM_ASM_000268 /TAXON_ID=218659 /ORGANISM="Vexillifera sp., Strain DIVA3 564/2" /LENGTH=181 /DNA_ID=CAMNT_0047973565 /DNA_START=396 /DNA_END=937 /DNA_ORIENTATION=+